MSKIATVPFGETRLVAAAWEPDGTHIANLLEACYRALENLQRTRKTLSKELGQKDFCAATQSTNSLKSRMKIRTLNQG
jgi:hypothetical protein